MIVPNAGAPRPQLAVAGVGQALTTLDVPLPTQLLRIAIRRRWIVISAVGVALVLGLIITLLTTPLYMSTIELEISREGNQVTNIQGVQRESNAADSEFYQTQYGLLKSQSLAEAVARNLKLTDDPAFFAAFRVKYEKIGERRNLRGAALRAAHARAAGAILLNQLQIAPVRNSRLVNISWTGPDAALAARVANAWGQNYIDMNLSRRFEATSYARRFLEGRLEQLRQRLEESERQLVTYASEQRIINLPGTVDRATGQASGERSLLVDEVASLNEALATATADRIAAQSQLARAQSDGSNTSALQNIAINGLREKRAELAGDYAKYMVQFQPDYPPAKALASQIASLDQAINRETARVGSSYRTLYENSKVREDALRARVEGLKTSLTDLRRRSIQYNIFQRDVDTNRQLYDGLLQRYKEIGVAGGVGTNNISVVDNAEIAEKPSRPDFKLNMALAILLGLIVGGGIAWLAEQVEEGISDPTDVPKLLGAPLLGTVPTSDAESPLLDLQNPKSPLVEAYIAVQTNLELSTSQGAPRSISVTSTRPREGKSTTAYALAHSLARARRQVVLIDCDLRSPMVHNEFNVPNTIGVSNFLTGNDDLSSSLHATDQPGLTVMAAGPQPPNAADLLTGDRLRLLIDRLLERFDHVVVDSPPVMGLADAPLIASAVEGTIYAVEARMIRAALVRIAMQRLHSANANMLGVVLTKFDAKQSSTGYGYDYGYGYGPAKSV